MLNWHNRQGGFSLIELMITIALVGILMVMGAPAFSDWIQSSQVRTAAESITNGLQLARAEAVRRNTRIRFNLNSATGLVDWEICASENSPCTPTTDIIQQRSSAEGSVNARVGVYNNGDGNSATSYSTVIAAGNELPAHVTFDSLGRTIDDGGGNNVIRIDVTNAVNASARRLVITIGLPGGEIRMCDPALTVSNPTDPMAC
jgi:type IV fimbrial biogenesis protein FimT